MKNSYFNLFSNCVLVKGKSMSLISDIQLGKIYHIPNDCGEILMYLKKKSIEECYNYYGIDNKDTIDEYLDFFLSIKVGFIDHKLHKELSKINFQWDYYSDITNCIIEYNSSINYDYLLYSLEELNIDAIEIRFYKHIPFDELSLFLEKFENSKFQSIEILIQYSSFQEIENDIDSFVKKYSRLSKIFVSNCAEEKISKVFEDSVTISFIDKNINSCLSCGNIDIKYFKLNMSLFCESLNYNSCLNKKLAVDTNGNIKNCPSMLQSFGNIKDATLKDVFDDSDFKKYWSITKDEIEICKDCEFRYICTDCRAYTERTHTNSEGLDISKPLKCGYDPYTNIWDEWITNPLKQKAIQHYGIQNLTKLK